MLGFKESDDYAPTAWIGRYPIYSAGLLAILHVAAMVLLVLVPPDIRLGLINAMAFHSDAFQRLHFWQFVTYAFINFPTIWFVLDMAMLVWFGQEVEKFIGRRGFLTLYGVLLVLPPCLLSAAGFWMGGGLAGPRDLHFAVFLAFVTLYPGVQFFFGIPAKWVAWIFLGIYSLEGLANRDFIDLLALWSSASAAFLYIDYSRGFPFFDRFKEPKDSTQRLPPKVRKPPKPDVVESIDPLLDKIAKSGLSSLSAGEREKLERASAALTKRGAKRNDES